MLSMRLSWSALRLHDWIQTGSSRGRACVCCRALDIKFQTLAAPKIYLSTDTARLLRAILTRLALLAATTLAASLEKELTWDVSFRSPR